MSGTRPTRIAWKPVLAHAARLVAQYATPVTLRQLFYRLVSDGTLPNTSYCYKHLSEVSAKGRRDGTFPDLHDRTRGVRRLVSFKGPDDARTYLRDIYRRERSEGQPFNVYIGVEKAGMIAQLSAWFDPLGLPIVSYGGYASQSLCSQVQREVGTDPRVSVLIGASDFDASGIDIDRDFVERCGFDHYVRIAVLEDQVREYGLPPNMIDPEDAKADTRNAAFIAQFGYLAQVELDALAPEDLRALYEDELANWWDDDAYQRSLAAEQRDREAL